MGLNLSTGSRSTVSGRNRFGFSTAILSVGFRQFLDLTCLISAEVAPATDPIGIEQLRVGGLQAYSKFEDEIVGGRKDIADIHLRPCQQPCPLCKLVYSA